jgi:hypothetical protein
MVPIYKHFLTNNPIRNFLSSVCSTLNGNDRDTCQLWLTNLFGVTIFIIVYNLCIMFF